MARQIQVQLQVREDFLTTPSTQACYGEDTTLDSDSSFIAGAGSGLKKWRKIICMPKNRPAYTEWEFPAGFNLERWLYAQCMKESTCRDLPCREVTVNGKTYTVCGKYQITDVFVEDLKLWYCQRKFTSPTVKDDKGKDVPNPNFSQQAVDICTYLTGKTAEDARDEATARRMIELWLHGRWGYLLKPRSGESIKNWLKRVREIYYGVDNKDFERWWKFWEDWQRQNGGGTPNN